MVSQAPHQEFVEHEENLPFRTFLHSVRSCAPHSHKDCEFLLTLKGDVQVQSGEGEFIMHEGDLCFIPSGQIHMTEGITKNNILVVLQIDTNLARHGDPEFAQRHFKFNKMPQVQRKDALEKLRALIAEISWEMRMRQSGYRLHCEALALTLLSTLVRQVPSKLSAQDDTEESEDADLGDRLRRIVSYMEAHSAEEISSGQIAEQENVSPSYLARLFKTRLACTFSDYLNMLRAKKSLALLAKTEYSILDVAMESGFPNIKSFNTVFKRTFEMTPSEWRRDNKGASIPGIGESAYGRFDKGYAYSLLKRYLPIQLKQSL